MGRRGAVVACATCKRVIAVGVIGCDVHGIVLLGKAPHPHVHSLDPRVDGYLVGPTRSVYVISPVHQKLWLSDCTLPGLALDTGL